jgi:hypothetical protein
MNARTLRLIVTIGLVAATALFVLVNWHRVYMNFLYIADVNAPLALVVIGAGAVGFALGRLWKRPPRA